MNARTPGQTGRIGLKSFIKIKMFSCIQSNVDVLQRSDVYYIRF